MSDQWISAEERLPKPSEVVLFVCDRHKEICLGSKSSIEATMWYDNLNLDSYGDPNMEFDVTHWMPLPEPPSE